jgi:hypothetical protein
MAKRRNEKIDTEATDRLTEYSTANDEALTPDSLEVPREDSVPVLGPQSSFGPANDEPKMPCEFCGRPALVIIRATTKSECTTRTDDSAMDKGYTLCYRCCEALLDALESDTMTDARGAYSKPTEIGEATDEGRWAGWYKVGSSLLASFRSVVTFGRDKAHIWSHRWRTT